MPAPRPFGVGPYGTGPYSRYTGAIYDAGGRCTLLFGAKAQGASIIIQPWAVGAIYFDAWAEHFDGSWILPPACEPGTWTPGAPCETGSWTAPGGCSAGSWRPPQ